MRWDTRPTVSKWGFCGGYWCRKGPSCEAGPAWRRVGLSDAVVPPKDELLSGAEGAEVLGRPVRPVNGDVLHRSRLSQTDVNPRIVGGAVAVGGADVAGDHPGTDAQRQCRPQRIPSVLVKYAEQDPTPALLDDIVQ